MPTIKDYLTARKAYDSNRANELASIEATLKTVLTGVNTYAAQLGHALSRLNTLQKIKPPEHPAFVENEREIREKDLLAAQTQQKAKEAARLEAVRIEAAKVAAAKAQAEKAK
jgi:hypothetical protein